MGEEPGSANTCHANNNEAKNEIARYCHTLCRCVEHLECIGDATIICGYAVLHAKRAAGLRPPRSMLERAGGRTAFFVRK